jgi:hypothetical protein
MTWEAEIAAVIDQHREEALNASPYKIFREGSIYVVKNNAGMVKARFATRQRALKYLRALYVNVKGAPGKAKHTKWTGDEPKPKGAKPIPRKVLPAKGKESAGVAQDNDAYRQGVADRLAKRPMLTREQFNDTHPGHDADDYPLYMAGYKSDRDDLRLRLVTWKTSRRTASR